MSKEFTDANRAFFDDLAANYDTKPWQQKLVAQLTTFLRSNLDFIGADWAQPGKHETREVRLLDYACGTGMVSRALAPHITTALGIDLSPAMVARYNALTLAAGHPSPNFRAVTGDLLAAAKETTATEESNAAETPNATLPLNGEDFHNFDIIAVSAALHHFHDPATAVSILTNRLKPGGTLVILDFLAGGNGGRWGHNDHAHHGHGHENHATKAGFGEEPFPGHHTVRSHGFSEEGLRGLFEGAGLLGWGWRVLEEEVVLMVGDGEGREVVTRVFLARSVRA